MNQGTDCVKNPGLELAWTTVDKREDAERLARGLIGERLAFCVQIDGGVTSYYRWQGSVQADDEIRIWIKFAKTNAAQVFSWVATNHPYDTPQWIVVEPTSASAAYAQWAKEVSGSAGS